MAKKIDLDTMKDNYIYLNSEDRKYLDAGLNDKILVQIIDTPTLIDTLVVTITDRTKKEQSFTKIDDIMVQIVKNLLNGTVVNNNTFIGFYHQNGQIMYAKIMGITDVNENSLANGLVYHDSKIAIYCEEDKALQINLSSINFEIVGVGGLEQQFIELTKKVFLTRIISPKLLKKLGIRHTKGVILYGPPGCGKTIIAKKIGELIGCKKQNVKVVNGPELLNKYVGESEKNIRECFEVAKNNPNELHLLIFDEFDAIATRRSGSENNNNDKVVAQLLTMMDGAEEISNIIVFALTNRIDIIDPAILRPGRFGVHLKIDLPDTTGRYQILVIHTSALLENKAFSSDVDLMKIAELTDSYTGAELENLVQMTVQDNMGNQIDFKNIVESAKKIDNIVITQKDFIRSIDKIIPMFKNNTKVVSDLLNKIKIKDFNESVSKEFINIVNRIKSRPFPSIICIGGLPKSGKTSLVCDIAINSSIDNIEYISAATIINMAERGKMEHLTEIFSRQIKSLIILDNVETIIEYVSEMIFNKNLLHVIKVLLSESKHHVIITTSYYKKLKQMTILDSVDYVVEL